MSILDKIFTEDVLVTNPPVLLDIGASAEILGEWKELAKYSRCIAFDADSREMQYIEKESNNFSSLIVYNCILTDLSEKQSPFFLTQFPQCSSTLKPCTDKLQDWHFRHYFDIAAEVNVKTIRLTEVIEEQGLRSIDWFKVDSQGTDLRLFRSLPKHFVDNILVVDFEPGLFSVYEGEDRLFSILEYMDKLPFWISNCVVKGSKRISKSIADKYLKSFPFCLKDSPGWIEISYVNSFSSNEVCTKRNLLLGCAFSIVKGQFGFVLELADKGLSQYGDEVFYSIKDYALKSMKPPSSVGTFAKRLMHKLARSF